YDQVFSEQAQTKLLGVDAYYHLRQAKYIVKNYPQIQRWDSGSHYPKRLKNRATGLFAFSVASISILLYSSDANTDEIAAVAAWFPPVLHIISMLFLYFLTVKLLNKRAGLLAILLFAIYPGNTLDRSILGFADHHVMEYCLAIAIALSLVF
ncbi:MAG: STT3 domain-containing protein, partial [Colwellia sp.]